MTNRIKLAGLLFISVLVLATCTYRSRDPNICFDEDVFPIFTANCIGCHGGSGGYKFTSYNDILKGVVKGHPLRSPIYKAIKGNTPKMPPASHKQLTSEQVSIIKTWISMGAPNSSNCGGCDTSQYKFSADIQPLMDTWCVQCHSATTPNGGFNLTNYNGVKNCAQSGMMMGSIKHSSGYLPMPQTLPKLSDCKIQQIQNWVDAGCPNN